MEPTAPVRSVGRFLYNHNPFYIVSALLMLYALKLSFRPGEVPYIDPWALMSAIGGYTLLMAVTGYLVVKRGRVWEDARSIFLVILLMFLAGSVSLDELLNLHPQTGRALPIGGLVFVVLVTETILRSLKIRLPWFYRGPYYAFWSLCFLAPLFVAPELTGLKPLDTAWRLAAFSPLAGLIALSLIPAVRRGPAAVAANGTPWGWPLYPWTLFVFLGLAAGFRSYALTISFLPMDGMQTAFCTYFLVPFALAVLVLLLEFAIRNGSHRFQRGVLTASAGLLLLAIPRVDGDPVSAAFLNAWTARLGSPLYLTAVSLAGFALYAELRRSRGVDLLLTVSLLALTVIGPQTINGATLVPVQPLPLALLAVWFAVRALVRRRSQEWLEAIAFLVVALSRAPELIPFPGARGLAIYHAAMGLTTLLAILGRDRLAKVLRLLTALWLPASAWVALQIGREVLSTNAAWFLYALSMLACVSLCWWVTRDRVYLLAGLGMASAGTAASVWLGLRLLNDLWGTPRLLAILGSLASFLVAVGISLRKAVALPRLKSSA